MKNNDIEKKQNLDANKLLIDKISYKADKIMKGGGEEKIKKQHESNKLTARERIAYLIDEASRFYELGLFAAYGMYEEHGGCPAAGVVMGIGSVHGKQCMIVANDATVKAGAWFPMTGKKNLRAQEIAMENNIPIIYLVDSAGIFLPMQDEIFPDKEHFGRIFRNNAVMSSKGIYQIAAIMGSCVAGGAYLPIMSDESIIIQKTGSIFLAGPFLVKAAIGEDVDYETLGGARTQTALSGIVDYSVKTDEEGLDLIRSIIAKIGDNEKAGLTRREPVLPKRNIEEMLAILPADRTKPYSTRELLECLVDNSEISYFKEDYGKTIITAYANIDGWAVGIIANERLVVKSESGEMQFGGVIYSDSADKAARFIMSCNQKKIPLIFLHDVTGFMVGKKSEHGGIIKDGAKMVNAVANSTVPKISIVIGNSYGAGNYAMCGKAYDPRFIFAWPSAKIAVMGGAQAANVLTQIQVSTLKKQGKDPDPETQNELLEKIKEKYDSTTTPFYAASRLWVDEIINPLETRQFISKSLEVANNAKIEKFNVGVLQT